MTKEDFLKKAAEKWEELKELKDTSANFHSYEKDFDELWINLGRETLEGSIGVPGSDRRKKKKIQTRYGKIEISKKCDWSESVNGYNISPYLQDLLLHAGQDDNFSAAEKGIEKYLRIPADDSQIERLCKTYGGLLENQAPELQEQIEESSKDLLSRVKEKGVAYGMIDGCILLTREPKDEENQKENEEQIEGIIKKEKRKTTEKSSSKINEKIGVCNLVEVDKESQVNQGDSIKKERIELVQIGKAERINNQEVIPIKEGAKEQELKEASKLNSSWREMKLGRIFIEPDRYTIGKNRTWIRESLYCSHFGAAQDFTAKFEHVVDSFDKLGNRLVFINDGATWIWRWVESTYPNAICILDCHHANQYLSNFAKIYFKEEKNRWEWENKQKQLLMEDGVEQVIENIDGLLAERKTVIEAKHKILTYFSNNRHRMLYKTYREQGLLIGSGPIESAHRFVIQKRMKQSGQRWTRKGGQKVANLRVAYLNNQWGYVVQLINNQVVAA